MKKKILVVDDEPDIVKLLQIRLVKEGYETISAYDGKSALEAVRDQNPDLVLLDVMMPQPNGFHVCRTLKDDPEFQHIPIILLTAKGSESDKFWGMEAGSDFYLTKPYHYKELSDKIHAFLD